MSLVKVLSGKLEKENYFMDSYITDFLGDGIWDFKEDSFSLKNGTIKRILPYNQFMIDIRKDVVFLDEDDMFSFFIEDESNKMGFLEESIKSKEYWRFIYYQNFVQVYTSDDGQIWENHGGEHYEYKQEFLQGFTTKGNKSLTLNNYNIYKSPYITIQNFKPGTTVKLYNKDGMYIKQRNFKEDYTCEMFLDYNIEGYLEFYFDNELLYTSNVRFFEHGDTYLFYDIRLQLLHNEVVLENETTVLYEYIEKLTLRNVENIVINNITLKVNNPNLDKIELSLNEETYNTEIIINEIKGYEDIPIYLRIIRNKHYKEFNFKKFNITIKT